MDDPSRAELLRYRVDNFLSRGSSALFLALLVAFFGAIASIAVLRGLLNLLWHDQSNPFFHQLWIIFLQVTDPGNMAQDNETPTVFKLPAMLAGFSGVVIFSALIAFLTTALDQTIASLKKGHSRVLEEGHTLILGWSPRVVEILRELIEANDSEDDAVVVILAEREKEEMDEELRAALPDRRTTRVVTRTGAPPSAQGLAMVAASKASSAIVLASCSAAAPADERAGSDATVVKTLLALAACAGLGGKGKLKIIAELFDAENRSVAEDIAPGHIHAIDTEDMLAKIMVQTSRTSGLAVVYSELLSFYGNELYFHEAKWGGCTFGEALFRYRAGVPIGIARGDGSVYIRPDPDEPLHAGDELIIVADDDSSLKFGKAGPSPQRLPLSASRGRKRRERVLLLGWSPKAETFIREYEGYVLAGSSADVALAAPSEALRARVEALDGGPDALAVRLIQGSPLDPAFLSSLNPFAYDNIVVFRCAPEFDTPPDRVDAESVLILLQLRRQLRALKDEGLAPATRILTEVLESENQDLVNQAGVNDFLIGTRLVSMVFAQLSEQPRMRGVYEELFKEDGSEIYVKPVELYLDSLPLKCTFADLMGLAQDRDGEICIGVKTGLLEHDSARNYGVVLAPKKKQEFVLQRGDALVVVANDEG